MKREPVSHLPLRTRSGSRLPRARPVRGPRSGYERGRLDRLGALTYPAKAAVVVGMSIERASS